MFIGRGRKAFEAETRSPVPGTRVSDTAGLLSGTRVATPSGWRPVEAIAVGDEVMTFDAGFQPVTALARALLWTPIEACPEELHPITVPAGLLGNRTPLRLLPDTGVMLESDLAEELTGDPFAVIPAHALLACPSVSRTCPEGYAEVISLGFAGEHLVYAEGGALLHCAGGYTAGPVTLDELLAEDAAPAYPHLDMAVARRIVRDLLAAEGPGLAA